MLAHSSAVAAPVRFTVIVWTCLVIGALGLASSVGCGKESAPTPNSPTTPNSLRDDAGPSKDPETDTFAPAQIAPAQIEKPADPHATAPAAALPERLPEGLPAGSVRLGDSRHRIERLEEFPPEVVFSNAYAVLGDAKAVRLADGVSWPLAPDVELRGANRFVVSGEAIYDLASNQPSHPLTPPEGASATPLPRPGLLATSTHGEGSALIDLTTGKPIAIAADSFLGAYRRERRVAGDAGPRVAFFDTLGPEIQVFDAATTQLVARGTLVPAPADDTALVLTADGGSLMWFTFENGPAVHVLALPAVAKANEAVDLARAPNRRVQVTGSNGPFPSDDGTRFAVVGADGVVFYDTATGQPVATRTIRRGDRISRRNARMTDANTFWYAFHGLTRVSANDTHLGPDHGDQRAPIKDHVFTTEGVTTVDADSVLMAWSHDGKPLRRIELEAPPYSMLRLASDGLRVTREIKDTKPPFGTSHVDLIDARTGAILGSTDLTSSGSVRYVAAGDGPVLIEVGSYQDTIQLWHHNALSAPTKVVGFSLHGQLLASDDATLWVRQTEQRVSHLDAALRPVRRLTLCGKNPKMNTPIALSPTGRSVAAICLDGSLVIASIEVDSRGAPVSEVRSPPLLAPEVPALSYVSEDRDAIVLAFCGEDAVLVQKPGTLWQVGRDGVVRSQQSLITPSARLRPPLRCEVSGKLALTTWLDGRSLLLPVVSSSGAHP